MKKYNANSGWFNESKRHSLASMGVKTGRKSSGMGLGLSKIDYKKEWINEELFARYEKVRRSGKINMADLKTVGQLTGIQREILLDIMNNYEYLSKKYPKVTDADYAKKEKMSKEELIKRVEYGELISTRSGDNWDSEFYKYNGDVYRVDKHRTRPYVHIKKVKSDELKKEGLDYAKRKHDVQLIDDGSLDTVISVNGREMRYSTEFGSLFRNKKGELTQKGFAQLKKMAVDDYENDADYARYNPANQIFVDRNFDGSLTISTDKNKQKYYGYNKVDAVRKFKKEFLKKKKPDYAKNHKYWDNEKKEWVLNSEKKGFKIKPRSVFSLSGEYYEKAKRPYYKKTDFAKINGREVTFIKSGDTIFANVGGEFGFVTGGKTKAESLKRMKDMIKEEGMPR
jgi:hypothetical protein